MIVSNTSYYGDTLTCLTYYDYVKKQKSCDRNTESYHKPYKFDFEVKDQRIRIMNVRNTSSRGDRPICQIWYANFKANKSNGSNTKTRQKPINLTLRSKVNVVWGTWMYATNRLMVIHPCAIYSKQEAHGPRRSPVNQNKSSINTFEKSYM